MAEVFDSNADNVGLHPRNVYSSGELEERATTEDFSVVQTEGRRRVRRTLKYYYLDATISIGYRVNTRRRVRFRQWATRTLRGHRVRVFTLNESRLTSLTVVDPLPTVGGGGPERSSPHSQQNREMSDGAKRCHAVLIGAKRCLEGDNLLILRVFS